MIGAFSQLGSTGCPVRGSVAQARGTHLRGLFAMATPLFVFHSLRATSSIFLIISSPYSNEPVRPPHTSMHCSSAPQHLSSQQVSYGLQPAGLTTLRMSP